MSTSTPASRRDEDLPAGHDGYEGGERTGHPLGQVEQSGDLDVDLGHEFDVVGHGLVDRAGQVQQGRHLGRDHPADQIRDDRRRQVECDEQPDEVVFERLEDGVVCPCPMAAHDRAKGGGCGDPVGRRVLRGHAGAPEAPFPAWSRAGRTPT